MRSIWVGIDSTSETTRVLATAGASETILKARLSPTAQHPRAVPALLEALAMWEGAKVRAALVVDGADGSSATRLCLDAWSDFGGDPLYSLEFVRGLRRRHRDRVGALGTFHDLRQLLLFEVAR
jgi:hypothetical protein